MQPSSRLIIGLAVSMIWLSGTGRCALATPRADNPSPAVVALLKQSTAVYKPMKSYQHLELWKIVSGGRSKEIKYTLALERPNKFAFKSSAPNDDTAVSDGKTFINYKSQTNEYTKMPAPATYAGINIVDDVVFQPYVTYLIALMLRGDALADKSFTSMIAQLKVGHTTLKGGTKADTLAMGNSDGTMTFYLDAATHRVVKSVQTFAKQAMTITEIVTDVKVNQQLPSTVFQYTPPEKSKLVATFSSPQSGQEAQEAALRTLAQKYEGKPASDFTMTSHDGKDISLASLRGKVVVVDFWASWCGPCKQVMPIIQEIHEKYGDKGVVVLAVNTWDTRADCDQFLKDNPQYTMTVPMDPAAENTAASVATKVYSVPGIPVTLIIDKEGIVRTYAVGAHERSFYMDALKKLGIEVAAK